MSIYIQHGPLKFILFILIILAFSSCRDWESRAEPRSATYHNTRAMDLYPITPFNEELLLNDIKARQLLYDGSRSLDVERLGQAD